MIVDQLNESDIGSVAAIHALSFPRQRMSEEWIRCNFSARPRIRMYAARRDHQVVGYIMWTEKSGLRDEVVLELDQIAVITDCRSTGIGEALIRESLPLVEKELAERGSTIKAILVSTRTDNSAQKLYRRVLGVKTLAVIPRLYSADEVLLGIVITGRN